MEVLFVVIGFTLGVIASILIFMLFMLGGTLRIDSVSNPERELYRFEVDDIENIGKKKFIVLTIDHNANLSAPSQK